MRPGRFFLTFAAAAGFALPAAAEGLPARRKPVALATLDGGRLLLAANRGAGTVSVLDTETGRCLGESAAGRGLSALAALPGGAGVVALDEAGGRLILLKREGDGLQAYDGLDIAGPVDLALSADGRRISVASKWARRLTFVALVPGADGLPRPGALRAIPLPFNPRRQALLERGGRAFLVAAEAFGGRLAVVDFDTGALLSVRPVQAHNIGGLAPSADGSRLHLTQQYLNARSATAEDDIHWGFLMTNSVRTLKVSALLDPADPLISGTDLDHLGAPGRGAGDPAGLLALPGGTLVSALSGVDEIALGPVEAPDAARIAVGARPTALAASPDGRVVYVANTLDDSIAVVDVPGRRVARTLSLGPVSAPSLADRGERVFHDSRLSHEGWMSCQSCHTDGHASLVKADTLGDGAYGAPKRTLSLLGVGDTPPYAWNGQAPTLEEQVRQSFQTTLRGKAAGDDQARAVAAYLRTLAPPPPVAREDDREAAGRGAALFQRAKCDRCHAPPAYTSAGAYDVGLEDEAGNRTFNPPSLRGVGQRDGFFHDGRARGLEEVFRRFGHPDGRDWSEAEAADLAAFLRGL